MSKTIELRKVITGLLKQTNVEVFYENAINTAKFPYIVYNFESVNFGNTGRDDIFLDIDIWDKNSSSIEVETIADYVEDILNSLNKPTDSILPTFYKENRRALQDEDKNIRRRQLRFIIQNYYIGG